jgi:hypothetical protein
MLEWLGLTALQVWQESQMPNALLAVGAGVPSLELEGARICGSRAWMLGSAPAASRWTMLSGWALTALSQILSVQQWLQLKEDRMSRVPYFKVCFSLAKSCRRFFPPDLMVVTVASVLEPAGGELTALRDYYG